MTSKPEWITAAQKLSNGSGGGGSCTPTIRPGAKVTLKNRKARATVVRMLDKPPPANNWRGWVELDQPLGGYLRHHIEDLEPCPIFVSTVAKP